MVYYNPAAGDEFGPGGPGQLAQPTPPPAPPAIAQPGPPAPTFNYPRPQNVWDQISQLQPVQQGQALMGGLQGQVDPYFSQQAAMLSGLNPYVQGGSSPSPVPGGGTMAEVPPGLFPNMTAGPSPIMGGPQLGGGAVSPFYQQASGLYGNMLEQAGGSLGQQQALLNQMGTPESFISSTRPYIQDIMKSMGRQGMESSSLSDRTVANTLGSLWSQNQMGLAQGYQNLAGAQAGLYGGAAQGLQGIGQGYQNLLGGLAGQYGQMGLNQANVTGNLINSWQNQLSGMGNLGALWYHPYDQMLGVTTAGGSVT